MGPPSVIDPTVMAGLERVNPESVQRYIERQDGQPLDTARRQRDLPRNDGDGDCERVDQSVVDEPGRHVGGGVPGR